MTLHAADEGFHVPPGPDVARWQENLFFILWDPSRLDGFMVHLQRVPSLGWQEAQVVASIGGMLASATLRRPFTPESAMPEMAMAAVDPFSRWHLRAEFDGTSGRGPLGFLFTRPGGPTRVEADLTLHSDLAPTDFAAGLHHVVDRLADRPSGAQMGQQQHYEQGGAWHGSLRIGDRQVETGGLFVRDHSWGVRHEQNEFRAFWTATCLDEGRVFCNAIGIHQGDRVVGIGALTDATGTRFTDEVRSVYEPTPGICSYDRARVYFGAGIDLVLEARTQVHVPMYLPHSGPRRYDNNAISTVSTGGLAGFGVMEWADVLAPDEDAAVDVSGFSGPAVVPRSRPG